MVKLQSKIVRVINNVPLRDHITPHYVNLGLIKLPDIIKLNTCQLIYDHFVDKKPSNFTLSLVSEQHNYDTRSASLQHLNASSLGINIRKFCSTVIGCYYWNNIPLSIREKIAKKLFKRALFNYYIACSVLIIADTDSQMLSFLCVCVLFFFPLFYIIFIVYRVYTVIFFFLF